MQLRFKSYDLLCIASIKTDVCNYTDYCLFGQGLKFGQCVSEISSFHAFFAEVLVISPLKTARWVTEGPLKILSKLAFG